MSGSSLETPSFWISHQNHICISLLPNSRYMPCPLDAVVARSETLSRQVGENEETPRHLGTDSNREPLKRNPLALQQVFDTDNYHDDYYYYYYGSRFS
jgi:hypothetical protein